MKCDFKVTDGVFGSTGHSLPTFDDAVEWFNGSGLTWANVLLIRTKRHGALTTQQPEIFVTRLERQNEQLPLAG